MPGLGKTRLVETLGTVLGLDNTRVQCTPDLMPADILGSEVLEEAESGRRSFRFIKGPVFTQLLMADEINRASPRTQSALLQAMQEHRVSVAGHYHPLPAPFHVLATQNPLEQEGTYLLPEAQLDRFLLQIDVGYPSPEAERTMLLATTGAEQDEPHEVMSAGDLLAAQKLIRRVPVGAAFPVELADARASEDKLAPLVELSGGKLAWINDGRLPDLRRFKPGRESGGVNWMGFRTNADYRVTGLSLMPLLPALLILLLGLGGLVFAWQREGR